MSRRAELYRVVRDLKGYLKWQSASGAAGSVAASAQEREAFKAKKEARQKAKLERLTRVESDDGVPASVASFGEKANFGEKTKPSSEAPSSGVAETTPGSTPWKTGGSRPTPRFDTSRGNTSRGNTSRGNKPQKPASQNNAASADKQTSKDKQASMSSNDNSPPSVDYDSSYPEASGIDQADNFDPSREPVEATSKTPQKPKKDPKNMGKPEKLEFLEKYLGDCKRCGLCESRTNIVFGVGDPEAKLVFVGEAPGSNEDQQGEPFVGKAGKLLDKMIGAMGLEREDVYICNVIKCRPPDNRDPHVDEIKECAPFLRKQLGVVEPTVIVTLGKFASQFLTDQEETMGAMRGSWHEWEGIAVMPTYHPAYLLRSADQKGKTWSDLQMVMEKLELG
jgi:DNA polymerase